MAALPRCGTAGIPASRSRRRSRVRRVLVAAVEDVRSRSLARADAHMVRDGCTLLDLAGGAATASPGTRHASIRVVGAAVAPGTEHRAWARNASASTRRCRDGHGRTGHVAGLAPGDCIDRTEGLPPASRASGAGPRHPTQEVIHRRGHIRLGARRSPIRWCHGCAGRCFVFEVWRSSGTGER